MLERGETQRVSAELVPGNFREEIGVDSRKIRFMPTEPVSLTFLSDHISKCFHTNMDFHSSPRRFPAYLLLCLCLMISIGRGYGSQKVWLIHHPGREET
uniref:Uncharacterized protein n=1 Tax=Aegilops tauschii subsp. strangulata TaxID=200361 RepID=A0A453FQ90_AEGTS